MQDLGLWARSALGSDLAPDPPGAALGLPTKGTAGVCVAEADLEAAALRDACRTGNALAILGRRD